MDFELRFKQFGQAGFKPRQHGASEHKCQGSMSLEVSAPFWMSPLDVYWISIGFLLSSRLRGLCGTQALELIVEVSSFYEDSRSVNLSVQMIILHALL